jgi:hypothetical protein
MHCQQQKILLLSIHTWKQIENKHGNLSCSSGYSQEVITCFSLENNKRKDEVSSQIYVRNDCNIFITLYASLGHYIPSSIFVRNVWWLNILRNPNFVSTVNVSWIIKKVWTSKFLAEKVKTPWQFNPAEPSAKSEEKTYGFRRTDSGWRSLKSTKISFLTTYETKNYA